MLGDEAHVEEVGDGVEEVEIPRPSRAETLFIEILPPRPSAVQDASASPSSLVAVVPAPSPVPAEKPAPSPVPAEKPTVMDILGALNERDAESKEAKKEEQKAERTAKAEEQKAERTAKAEEKKKEKEVEKIAKEKIKEEERQKKEAAKEEQRQAREQLKEEERQEIHRLRNADMQELWVNKSKLSEKTLQQGAAKGRKRKADAAEVQEEEPPEKVAVRGDRFKEPFFSVERSRNQVMARTGFRGPGESVKFRYGGNGGDFADADAATYAAQCWVNEQRKIQGLD